MNMQGTEDHQRFWNNGTRFDFCPKQ